jgi:hypothetical protein
MTWSFLALIVVPVFIALALLGAVGALVALVVRPKNRWVLLALPAAVGLITVVLLVIVFALLLAGRVEPRTVAPATVPTALLSAAEVPPVVAHDPKELPKATSPRPSWIDAPPHLVGDAYQRSVCIGPYATRAECDAKLPEKLQDALDQYVEVFLGSSPVGAIRLPEEYLRQQLVKEQWEETRRYSVGPMKQLHVLLQFDRKLKERVIDEHRQTTISHRLKICAAGAASVLAVLATAYTYLRVSSRVRETHHD